MGIIITDPIIITHDETRKFAREAQTTEVIEPGVICSDGRLLFSVFLVDPGDPGGERPLCAFRCDGSDRVWSPR